AETFVEAAVGDPGLTIAGRLGIDVAVEERLGRSDPAGPEAAARDLAAVRLARDPVRQSRNSARMLRRLAAGEQAPGQVEAPPPEMHRASLPREAGPETLE